MKQNKNCIVCDKEFLASKTQKICSYECREKKKCDDRRNAWINKKPPAKGKGNPMSGPGPLPGWMLKFKHVRG